MNILIASTTYYPAANGQAVFTVNLAEGLVQRGHQVAVVMHGEGGRAYQKTRNGVSIHGLEGISLGFFYSGAHLVLFSEHEIQRIFDSVQPDIVHIHDHYPMCWDTYNVAHRHGLKVIGTNHFMPQNLMPYLSPVGWLKKVFKWLMWRWMFALYDRFDLVTAPSKFACDLLRSWGINAPALPISCGVDLKQFNHDESIDHRRWRQDYSLDPDKTLLLFVGRVDEEKKLHILIKALHKLQRKDIQLAITGKGAALNGLRRLARRLDLEDSVRFTGFVPDAALPALLNSADIFVMPSEAELLSIATLEAMACGLPVLAARAGALPELVSHGVNGCLFEAGNSADAARNIAFLVDHPQRRREMRQASLHRAQEHDVELVIDAYEDVYTALLEDTPISVIENVLQYHFSPQSTEAYK